MSSAASAARSAASTSAGRLSAREREPQVPVALGQRDDRAAGRDRDPHVGDAGDGAGGVEAAHLAQGARPPDREHHDAGRRPLAGMVAEREAERVAQDDLLQADAGAEAQRPGAQAADRAGRQLEHPDAVAVQPQLGVHGALAQAQRRRGGGRRRLDAAQPVGGEARRRHVDRLLEVRPLERVGLVEDGQHLGLALAQERLDRHLGARRVGLGQDRAGRVLPRGGQDRTYAGLGRARRGRVVGADHAAAGRERDRLEHGRQVDGAGVVAGREDAEARLGDVRGGEGAAHGQLVAGRGRRRGRVVREPEPLPGERRGRDAAVVDGDDGVQPDPARQPDDRVGRPLRPAQVDAERPVAPWRRRAPGAAPRRRPPRRRPPRRPRGNPRPGRSRSGAGGARGARPVPYVGWRP